MNKERLSRLITQYQKNLEFYRNAREFNEQDCRDEFISPLLESLDFNDKIQKALYESVLVSVKRIRELNNVLEQKKDKASVGVIEVEKENLSKRIEDDITKIYNLQF